MSQRGTPLPAAAMSKPPCLVFLMNVANLKKRRRANQAAPGYAAFMELSSTLIGVLIMLRLRFTGSFIKFWQFIG
jgi:hypothetical protein